MKEINKDTTINRTLDTLVGDMLRVFGYAQTSGYSMEKLQLNLNVLTNMACAIFTMYGDDNPYQWRSHYDVFGTAVQRKLARQGNLRLSAEKVPENFPPTFINTGINIIAYFRNEKIRIRFTLSDRSALIYRIMRTVLTQCDRNDTMKQIQAIGAVYAYTLKHGLACQMQPINSLLIAPMQLAFRYDGYGNRRNIIKFTDLKNPKFYYDCNYTDPNNIIVTHKRIRQRKPAKFALEMDPSTVTQKQEVQEASEQ